MFNFLDLENTKIDDILVMLENPEIMKGVIEAIPNTTADGFCIIARQHQENTKQDVRFVFFDPALKQFFVYTLVGKQIQTDRENALKKVLGTAFELLSRAMPADTINEIYEILLELLVQKSNGLPIVFDYTAYEEKGDPQNFFLMDSKKQKQDKINFNSIIEPTEIFAILLAKLKGMTVEATPEETDEETPEETDEETDEAKKKTRRGRPKKNG